MDTVYMDNNATTRVAPEVVETMLPFFSDFYGNPSSVHSAGERVSEKVHEAREQVAALIGSEPDEIIFTSGGTESDNTAVRSALASRPEKRHIVTSRVEHPAIRSLCRHLGTQGYRITEVPVSPNGELDMEAYRESLTQDTALVTLMWANNETGVLFPVKRAAAMALERAIPFHTDAVQAVGKIDIDVGSTDVSMLSLSGHKLHGPKGIGVLYVRRETPFHPLIIGGHQEDGRRAGTENTPAIIGLGKACELAARDQKEQKDRIRSMRDRLERGVIERVPESSVNGFGAPRLPNTSNISFETIEGESVLLMLNELGIFVSTGSACSSGSPEPSYVLRAMGLSPTTAQGSLRFSLSMDNRDEDVDAVLHSLPGIVEQLRSMSPLWKGNQPAHRAVA